MLRRFLMLVTLLLVLWVLPASAQDTLNRVSFNEIAFEFPDTLASGVTITRVPGDAPDAQVPGGPQAPSTRFELTNAATDPAAPGMESTDGATQSAGTISVFSTAGFADYTDYTTGLTNLQTLVQGQTDLTTYQVAATDGTSDLPFLPTAAGSQAIRARAQYLQTASLSGIAYVTAHRLDAAPFVSRDFVWTFQGTTTDGLYYVSVVIPLNTALFAETLPADFDMDAFNADTTAYLNESITTLNAGTSIDFSPSLDTLQALVSSITIGGQTTSSGTAGSDVAIATATAIPGEATTVPTAAPGTMNGLAAINWTLVSYGDPNAPTPALTTTPVNIYFSEQGVSGNAGCNSFGGFFEFNVNQLTLTNLTATQMACEDANVNTQEQALLTALGSVNSFEVVNGTLRLNYSGGVLVFVDANAVATSTAAATTPTAAPSVTATATP